MSGVGERWRKKWRATRGLGSVEKSRLTRWVFFSLLRGNVLGVFLRAGTGRICGLIVRKCYDNARVRTRARPGENSGSV